MVPTSARTVGCGLLLGALGACLGSLLFMAPPMAVGAQLNGNTLGEWLWVTLIAGVFASMFALAPGLLGGLLIAIVLLRLHTAGQLSRANATRTGLGIGAGMGVLLVAIFLGYQRATPESLSGVGPLVALAAMVVISALFGVGAARILAKQLT